MASEQDARRPRSTSESSSRRPARRPSSSEHASRTRRSSASGRSAQGSARRRPESRGASASTRPQNRRPSGNRRPAQQKRRSTAPRKGKAQSSLSTLIPGVQPQHLAIAAAVVCLVFVLLLHHLLRLGITVNDTKKTVWRGTTIEKLLDKGYADPTPGNLMAVDGALLEEGKGQRCTATINGAPATLDTKVPRKAVVTIGDGEDVVEEHDTKEEAIPYGTASSSREFDAYWTGSIHLLSDGQEGMRTIKTGKVSGKTVSEVTTPAIDAGYIIYTAKPTDKVAALTFDDGPWPETTSQILDILEQYGAKATFFTIGEQIAEHPEDLRRAQSLGCEVCTHTYDHAAGSGSGVNLTYMSSSEQVSELQKGYAAIADVLGEEPPHIMRAPGGNFFGSLIDTLWPYLDAEIGWDVDTEDWRQPGADAIAEMILSVQPGQVILMHDGGGDRSQTVEALRTALPQLIEQGYSFVTVDELLAYGMPDAAGSSESDAITLG